MEKKMNVYHYDNSRTILKLFLSSYDIELLTNNHIKKKV